MDNRGITRLNKPFRQTTTSSKKINEPYPLFITPGSCSNMRRAYDILPLATWQGVMSNIAFPPLSHPSLVCEQMARLTVLVFVLPAAVLVAWLCHAGIPACMPCSISNFRGFFIIFATIFPRLLPGFDFFGPHTWRNMTSALMWSLNSPRKAHALHPRGQTPAAPATHIPRHILQYVT
jgi:hypothetical protein